jgi:hypothetical protein
VRNSVVRSHINCIKTIERIQRVSGFEAFEIEPCRWHVTTCPLSTLATSSMSCTGNSWPSSTTESFRPLQKLPDHAISSVGLLSSRSRSARTEGCKALNVSCTSKDTSDEVFYTHHASCIFSISRLSAHSTDFLDQKVERTLY